ncbi:MAG TPA: hypothetical protein VF310_02855 [Vicinamibacteria bacterium]
MTMTSKADGPTPGSAWWPELLDLIEHLEAEAARREGRLPRSPAQICAAIESDWWWCLIPDP